MRRKPTHRWLGGRNLGENSVSARYRHWPMFPATPEWGYAMIVLDGSAAAVTTKPASSSVRSRSASRFEAIPGSDLIKSEYRLGPISSS